MPTVDGIVSGFDTTALVNASLAAYQVPIKGMKDELARYESQKEAVAGVRGRLNTLVETIRKMDSLDKFQSFKVSGPASGTESPAFTLTAGPGAGVGVHDIRVVELATAQLSASQGFDSKTAKTLGTGTLSVTIGAESHELTLGASTSSLQDLAGALDELDGVSAYIVDTGAASGRYQLVVRGEETGSANAITFDTSGLSGGLIPAFTEKTGARDALVEIDGLTVQSASNTVTGALPGLTLALHAETAAAQSVTVSEDLEAMRAKLKETVTAFNAAVDYHATQTVFNPEKGLRGALVGESTTRRALDDVGLMFSKGYTVAGTPLESLSLLGVTTGRDGKLEFDEEAFDGWMAKDPKAVREFLTASEGPLAKIAARVEELYVDPDEGALISRQKGIDSTIEALNDRIARSEERMEAYGKILRDQFTAMERILGQIRSTQGFLTNFFTSMTKGSE